MNYGLYSASEWIYPDGETNGVKTLTLNAARGGLIGFQFKLTGTEPGAQIAVDRAFGSAFDMEAYRLRDVQVDQNTGRVGFTWQESDGEPDYVTRRAPFRVYDALRPYRPGKEPAEGNDALYFCFFIPAEAVPGDHTERLTVTAGGEAVSFDVNIRVRRAVVPEKETLDVTNWFSLSNMAVRHGLEMWSEEHWDMIRRYGKLMRRARQNTFWVTRDLVDVKKADGAYRFDFSRAKRLISMYLDMGFQIIEGAQIASRRTWADAVFYTWNGEEKLDADTPEAYAFIRAYLAAWRAFLTENGWYGRLIQHVADEPYEKCRDGYYRLSSVVRQSLPGVPVIEAVEIPGLAGAVDIWVPKDRYYEEHREEFEKYRAAGNTLWFYTCCFPGGKYLNRLLDKPLIETRYLHWGNFRYRMPGFLHWGFNHWSKEQDPFENNAVPNGNVGNCLPAGDTHIVYPGGDGPWSSMRLENHRFGAQDYELFMLLAAKDEALADEIVGSMLRTFSDWNASPDAMEQARARLLDALES